MVGWGLGERVTRLKRTDWQLQNSHRDVKYSVGSTVNNTVITMYGARGGLGILGGHFIKYMIV